MPSIPEYKTSFYAMLPRLGIKMADRSQYEINTVNSSLDELGDYPAEWFPLLEAEAVRRGVENPLKILQVMSVSKARSIPPGEKPQAFTESHGQRIDDDYIADYISEQLLRSQCDHESECRALHYRQSLSEVTK